MQSCRSISQQLDEEAAMSNQLETDLATVRDGDLTLRLALDSDALEKRNLRVKEAFAAVYGPVRPQSLLSLISDVVDSQHEDGSWGSDDSPRLKPALTAQTIVLLWRLGIRYNVHSSNTATSMRMMVGRVVHTRPHPNADRIRIALVDLGDGRLRQIVYGGVRILRPGDLVPVAPPGSRLPNGVKMRRRRYRGVASDGMLCSFQEMSGTSMTGPDEVHVLPSTLEPGLFLDEVRHHP
jgi:tRNA-binding EMAP/Myf-like protein